MSQTSAPHASPHASPRASVSTWSLHNYLGASPITGPADEPGATISGVSAQKLLELPAKIAELGIQTLEICHFHLPTQDAQFLAELRAEMERNRIELWALLIDGGDLNDSQHAARDRKWMESWLSIAAQLVAKTARVIAGQGAPTPSNLAKSIAALRPMSRLAQQNGVQLTTENWFALTSTPEAVCQIIDQVDGLGLCLDFGNWGGPSKPEKYALLEQIAPLATSCHTKAFFEDGQIAREDFERCLKMMRAVNFSGPHTLIYDAGGDEWQGLQQELDILKSFLV